MIKIDHGNLFVYQHDNGILNFKLNNRTLVEGDKVYFLAKKEYDQDYYDIELIVDTFENGKAEIFIPEQYTANAGVYKYAICVHTSDGLISTVMAGKLKILEGVHHESE